MSEVKLRLPIYKESKIIYDSLINAESLKKWFAENAEISIDEKKYNFWGKHTPGNPGVNESSHNIIEMIENQKLSFDWHLRGVDTKVEYSLIKRENYTDLILTHTSLPELKPYQSSIGDFWSHVLEGMRSWLETGRSCQLMDFSKDIRGDVSVSVNIASNPHDVFLGLTEPVRMNRWVAKDAKIDPKVGGNIDYGWGGGPVKILEIETDKKLSFSWQWEGEPETVTTWELEDSDGGTKLTVVQSGFAPERNSEDYYIGWYKFIHRFKSMLESGDDWSKVEIFKDDVEINS